MISKMYSSLYFVFITFVLLVNSLPRKKEHKDLTLENFYKMSRNMSCIFPSETIYSQTGADKALLQPCNTTNGTKEPEACSTFFLVSLQLCMAINKDIANKSKTLASKFEINIMEEATKLENSLCELTQYKDVNILNYATYMSSHLQCERVCNNTKKICALLVVALCKIYNSTHYCDLPPNSGPTTVGNLPETTTTLPNMTPPLNTTNNGQSITTTSTTEGDSGKITPNENDTVKEAGDITKPPTTDENVESGENSLKENQDKDKGVTDKDKVVTDKDKEGEDNDKEVTDKDKEGEDNDKEFTDKDKEGEDNDKEVTDKDKVVTDKDKEGEDNDKEVTDKDKVVTDKDKEGEDNDKVGTNKDKVVTDKDKENKKTETKGEEKDEVVVYNEKNSELDEESHGSGHFIAYFLTAVVICVAGYIIFHNKQKIIAFVVEGRSAHSRRQRSKGVKYTELKSNVEEVMPSLEKTATAKNFVY